MFKLVLIADTVLHDWLQIWLLHSLEHWLGQLDERRAEIERCTDWLLEVVVCAAGEVFEALSRHVDYWTQLLLNDLNIFWLHDANQSEPTVHQIRIYKAIRLRSNHVRFGAVGAPQVA